MRIERHICVLLNGSVKITSAPWFRLHPLGWWVGEYKMLRNVLEAMYFKQAYTAIVKLKRMCHAIKEDTKPFNVRFSVHLRQRPVPLPVQYEDDLSTEIPAQIMRPAIQQIESCSYTNPFRQSPVNLAKCPRLYIACDRSNGLYFTLLVTVVMVFTLHCL